MEHSLLNEQQQKHADVVTRMIARGVMPTDEELRATRAVLACGCPEVLLRSVVAKNAVVARSRSSRSLKFSRTAQTRGDGAFIFFEGVQRFIPKKQLDEIVNTAWTGIMRKRLDRKRLDRIVATKVEARLAQQAQERLRRLDF
jgi:hypothetical protein